MKEEAAILAEFLFNVLINNSRRRLVIKLSTESVKFTKFVKIINFIAAEAAEAVKATEIFIQHYISFLDKLFLMIFLTRTLFS